MRIAENMKGLMQSLHGFPGTRMAVGAPNEEILQAAVQMASRAKAKSNAKYVGDAEMKMTIQSP